mmetsp:Transcript_4456/g.10083  ORF Transcript_4456/g.10083 Transcript_4456/m.10083 type:complete len:326 (+) Transcript_4456:44-1021(+)
MRSFTTDGQTTARTSSKMINRGRPEDKTPPSIITSFETTPSKEAKRTTRGSPQRRQKANHFWIVLLVVPLFLFAYLLSRMVDLSFLGGVFLMGLRPPADDEVGVNVDHIDQEIMDFPDDWKTYDYNDIREHFDCRSRSKDNEKPLPSLEEWQFMRNKFTQIVDGTNKWDDPVPPTLGYSLEKGIPVPPPYHAKFSAGKGRGLFASRDIKKGEVVHDGTVSDVIFPNAVVWRRFVFSLTPEMACDCTDWHWMQKLEEGGKYFMVAGINISSLMNSGGEEYGPGGLPNALPHSSTSGKFYASRDIREGDEILTDYDAYYTNWKEVGL